MVSSINGTSSGSSTAGVQQSSAVGSSNAADSAGFEAQLAELQRVSQEAQVRSVETRRLTTELSSQNKVANERVS